MARAPLLSLWGALCLLIPGCSSQQVSQPPSVSVTPGVDVTLPCTLSVASKISGYRVHWYQQKHGGAPLFVYHYYTSSDQARGSGIPDRFSVTPDTSGNLWNLVITEAQQQDEAQYYCSTWTGQSWIFGGGTQLSVLSGEIKAPTLSIFPPSTEEIATQKATLVCQCQDFYPAALSWTWTVNGETITTGVGSTRPTKQTDNNLFMAGSLLSIDAIDWNADKKYTCMATHEGKTFQASVKHSECV